MLVDIFSSFDDHNSVFLSAYVFVWTITLVLLLSFNSGYWLSGSRFSQTIMTPKSVIFSQISRSLGKSLGGFTSLLSGLFVFLIVFNLAGLIPYVFSATSHLAVTLSLGFPLWLSLIVSGVAFNPTSVAASLLPAGAPAALNPFLVIVETVSICVRPITLSVRLAANMSAGHIVLGLIGVYLSASVFVFPVTAMGLLVAVQVLYFMFEVGVSLIQAYIFSLLVTLYSDEHPKHL
uniref:ATP synthase F0 subunit 6 n=1 Tax=Clithon lentiginosum TaxID=1891254 RepID=UPI001FF42F0D|nr:ATP synthase F0 subunit 6 [Clithon lentiginosum]UOH96854.1 ATP synthase F0 subunit 6 [Clithon lentiginosum]URF21495.1 ATP synthase F0 subunit 6 [Clithon lentiginosum]